MSKQGIFLTGILFVNLFALAYSEEVLLYDNSIDTGSWFSPSLYGYSEVCDYGQADAGTVTKLEFAYVTTLSNPGTITIRFYSYVTAASDPGFPILQFSVSGLAGSWNGAAYIFYKEVELSENQQFSLNNGQSFGYSFEYSNSNTGAALASGGNGNQNQFWVYDDFISWWSPTSFGGSPWAGCYLQLYQDIGPSIDEITCDISGYKFDDVDGNGVWDASEPNIPGWEIYLDENGNGTYEPSEPNTVTDADGMYFFENLDAPATYRVREIVKDGWTQTLPGGPDNEYVVVAEPNNVYGPYDFGNTDQLLSEITISGFIKEGTAALEGVYVEAYQNGDTPTGRIDHTDSQGYYEIQLPSPWSGNLVLQKHGYLFDTTIDYSERDTDITEDINGTFLYGGGEGSQSVPFEIWTAQQMNNIGQNPFDSDRHFVLMADIDLGIYSGTAYAMIEYFSGVFEGNDHVISNFTYSTSTDVHTIAIFRAVQGENALIRNLTLDNPQISADQSWDVAPLVGYLYQGTVSNCHVIGGQVSGMWFVGGLVADNYYFDQTHGGILENCSSSCDVTGFALSQTYVGGLVAHNSGLIRSCYATGNVSGNTYLGGLAGGISQSIIPSESGAIYNSYATGQVTGTRKVGGLIGYNSGAVVTHCYSTGLVSGTTEVGGLCGKNRTDGLVLGQFDNCFWDRETSDRTTSDGGTGLDTEDMQDELTFLIAGWDLEDETANGSEDLWKICPDGADYPKLSWQAMQCSGTEIILYPTADTYVMSTEPDTNYGSSTSLVAGTSSSTGAVYRSFLKFDMAQIPDGYRIISAQLDLQANMVPFVDLEIGAWFTSENWDESEMTWNDQVSPYDVLPTDTCVASIDYNRWDVTDVADDRYCYDRELSILLKSTDENFLYSAGFWSNELPTQTNKPRLIVYYAPIFGGGKGTADDPFQIWTAEQMNSIGLYSNRWDRSYQLMDDISMAGYTGSNYNQIGKWSTSIVDRTPFKGVFDGDGHTISDFQAGALFDYVSSGRIQQLGLIAPNVSDDGALVDRLEWGEVAECWVQGGSVNGGSSVGGLVGFFWLSNMAGCRSSADVSGTNYVGGLIGTSDSLGHIENCYASGSVSGQDRVGGFIGNAEDSIIVNCYSTGLVSGISEFGGFCGYAENLFLPPDVAVGCFWDTTSSNQAGSAVGTPLATVAMQNQVTFTTAGWDFVAETANGRNDDWAIPAGGGYPVLWYQLSATPPLPGFAGGNGAAGNPYLIATVEQLNSIGHNTRLLDQHFRLINDLDLSDQPFAMIADGPYAFMGSFDGNSHVIKNVSLSIPSYHCNIGFVGSNYNGNVYDLTLQNVSVTAEYARNTGSLIGMNRSGLVQNCHSLNVNVTGLWNVGGLVGSNYWHATIAECSVIGSVAESSVIPILNSGVGGIVGENSYWSRIETSGFVGDIAGDDFLGGLVGSDFIFSQLTDCYATGTINSTERYIGGLAGRTIGAEFTRCYAACEITAPAEETRIGAMAGHEQSGTYTDCFWDDQINGALPGFGYTNSRTVLIDTVGETTENMKAMTTYTSEGWDFGNVWRICDGMNYPRIKFHPKLAGDFVCPEGVEFADLMLLIEEWLAAVPLPSVDIAPEGSPDGKANLLDYSIIVENWLLGVD